MSGFFRFKQFKVVQEGVAMRVNTDGVLLGAWAGLPQSPPGRTDALKALDIGTGSGVIALMLAQRLSAAHPARNFLMDALEPHPSSAQAACENFANSSWAANMRLFSNTLQDYLKNHTVFEYDLIVSNPPFFENSLRPPRQERSFVRHTDSLSHIELLEGVAALLHPCGCFSVVLPALQKEHFIKAAATLGLYLHRETIVYTKPSRPPERSLMEFVKKEKSLQSDSLSIHKADGKSYTDEYMKLTLSFYVTF